MLNARDVRRLYRRFQSDESLMRVGAMKLQAQTMDRFATGGASSGTPWAPKRAREWGYNDGRAILTGASGMLLKAWGQEWGRDWATHGNFMPYALVQQLGTVGKGGKLPTIKPKKAKALFIPITDKAMNSARLSGEHGDFERRQTGMMSWGAPANYGPVRFGVTLRGGKNGARGTIEYGSLVKGRLKDGRLQRQDPQTGEWSDGVPDFIFLSKVDLPPRPMLPTASNERRDLCDTLMDFMLTRRVPRN